MAVDADQLHLNVNVCSDATGKWKWQQLKQETFLH